MVIHQFNKLIRNKWIWGVFAVLISVFFAFDFLFTGGDAEPAAGEAGSLGGEEVTSAQFREIAEELRGLGRQRDNATPQHEINRRTWETLGALAVAKDVHLTAGDDEVREVIRRDPSFQENGAFNPMRYELLLRENYLTPERFEASVRRGITLSKINRAILGGASWVSPLEMEGAVNDWTDSFTVRTVTFSDKKAASVKLDDAGLKAYYNDNTNSLAMPDCVTVKYVKFQADAPARLAQFKITDDELHDHYDATGDRFETVGTNGVKTAKPFEQVKGILEKELQLIASIEAYRTNLLFRAYPQDPASAGKKVDRLVQIAKEDKQKVRTSPLFSLDGSKFVRGFMSRPSVFVPDCKDFAAAVAELDPESADLRYGVVAGTNAVYLIERDRFVKAHVPSFDEAKNVIRADALADARAKAFKASVDKTRARAAAELAKNKPFSAKMFVDTFAPTNIFAENGLFFASSAAARARVLSTDELAKNKPFSAKMFVGANVSTAITFSVSSIQYNSFPNAMTIAAPTMKLKKGQISEFISTGLAGNGLLVYVQDRKPGDAAAAQMVRAQLRDDLARMSSGPLVTDWNAWNLARLGYTTTAVTSVEAADDDGLDQED